MTINWISTCQKIGFPHDKIHYNQNKNSLEYTYNMLLKNKYCDIEGKLLAKYPSFNQFYRFYRKTRKMQNELISRNGLGDYQRRTCIMAVTACINGHRMWNGDGKPVIWAFKIADLRKFEGRSKIGREIGQTVNLPGTEKLTESD